MLDDALKILNIIDGNGFQAYIVGGFVRDYLLGRKSSDVDISTNARPDDIKCMFSFAASNKYGVSVVNYNGNKYEITTFRKDANYVNNRWPSSISFVNTLEEDAKRRDFTINCIYMDKDKKLIDPFNGVHDLNNHIVKCVGNPDVKFKEDALRILRCIRFASLLNFKIDSDTVDAIKNNKDLLKNISYDRKKDELNKIFKFNPKYGIKLILDLDLEYALDIPNLKNIKDISSFASIWSFIDIGVYSFTNTERRMIDNYKKMC